MSLSDHDLDALMTETRWLSSLNYNGRRISHPSQTQHQCLHPLVEIIDDGRSHEQYEIIRRRSTNKACVTLHL